MPQTYPCLFAASPTSLEECARRIEPLLASTGMTFDKTIRKFGPGFEGNLYSDFESQKVGNFKDGVGAARRAGWTGLAFECTHHGAYVTIALHQKGSLTHLFFDVEGILFYEIERDEDLFSQWRALLLECASALVVPVVLFRRSGGLSELTPAFLQNALLTGDLTPFNSAWILLLIRNDVLPFEDISSLALESYRVTTGTAGYTVVTWLHARD